MAVEARLLVVTPTHLVARASSVMAVRVPLERLVALSVPVLQAGMARHRAVAVGVRLPLSQATVRVAKSRSRILEGSMAENIVQIKSLPGIKRDGTKFEGDQYVDGQWVRFQRGLPRKIGGFRSINKYLSSVARALHEYTLDLLTYVHAGSATSLERFFIDGSLNTSVISDRTPATLVASDANMWQFDVDTAAGTGLQLIAQVAPNLNCICNSAGGQLFYGDETGTAALAEVTLLPSPYSVTGGVVALHPYTVAFGNDGFVMWSVPGDPTDYTGSGAGNAYVTGQKLVRGMPLRGGPGNSPSGLLWSADALIRMSYVGGTPTFQFDTISAQSSILSAQSVIEYDGIFYWVGTDRFLLFNGVVREVENNLNLNYFFDNLNYAQRQKVFAMKVPRFGEIWWCFPFGDSTEPNHAVIYNVRENVWYDTELPNDGRAAGLSPAIFRRPLMTGVLPNEDDGYSVWVHETGVDEIDGLVVNPIMSYFETADLSLPAQSQINRAIQVLIMEPDFVQSGDMTVEVMGRANARSPEVNGEVKTIVETPQTPEEQIIYFKDQRRELRFRFTSNTVGGDYQTGLILAHVQPADGTVIG